MFSFIPSSFLKKLIAYNPDIGHRLPPESLNDPFEVTDEQHPLVALAVDQLQQHLHAQTEWQHNFGLGIANEPADVKPIGKMFGILVVQTESRELGFLAAFSGKLANSNHHDYFVPPVYDSLKKNGFLNQGMLRLKTINDKVRDLKAAGCRATGELIALQQQRKALSQSLQHQLFESYQFLNTEGKTQNPYDIFGKTPPAGAGECAAPKLLQYAYEHNLKPLAIREFWWGVPPTMDAASRFHGHYYPACEHKCRSILGWMLG